MKLIYQLGFIVAAGFTCLSISSCGGGGGNGRGVDAGATEEGFAPVSIENKVIHVDDSSVQGESLWVIISGDEFFTYGGRPIFRANGVLEFPDFLTNPDETNYLSNATYEYKKISSNTATNTVTLTVTVPEEHTCITYHINQTLNFNSESDIFVEETTTATLVEGDLENFPQVSSHYNARLENPEW